MNYQVRHIKFGIYQGTCMGLGLWHPMSHIPNFGIHKFHSKEEACNFVSFVCSSDCAEPLCFYDLIVEPFDFYLHNNLILFEDFASVDSNNFH